MAPNLRLSSEPWVQHTTGITHLEINPCLIKHIYASAMHSEASGSFSLSVLSVHHHRGDEDTAHDFLFSCSDMFSADILSDLVYMNKFYSGPSSLSSLDLLNKAAQELNPLMSLMYTNIFWQFHK